MNSTINDMDQITNNIWLGNYSSASNIDNLKNQGINNILCVMDTRPPAYKKEDNMNQKIINVADSPVQNIIRYFGESLSFIEGKDKILVHCMAGASRSATVVIAYIMWKEKKSFEEALGIVSKKRPCAFPNIGFRKQLKEFEKKLMENNYDLNRINFKEIIWKPKLSQLW